MTADTESADTESAETESAETESADTESADTESADQLLDAQVAWILGELTGDRLLGTIARDVEQVLQVADEVPLADLVDPAAVTRFIALLLERVPASTTTSTMVQAWTDVVYDGPPEAFTPNDLVAREHVEALVTHLLALDPVIERALDSQVESPMVGTIASRFVTRIVVEVLEANRSLTGRIPGVGSIVSMGTNAATKAIGAADKPLQQLLGAAKGGTTFAVRRLNSAIMATLRDPQLPGAVMEVWDRYADEPIRGGEGAVPRDHVHHVTGLLQEIVIAAAPTAPINAMVDAHVRAFFDVYGDYPVTTLLEELGLTTDDVVTQLQALLPPIVEAARAEGQLEAVIRSRLEPFYRSPEVAAILAG